MNWPCTTWGCMMTHLGKAATGLAVVAGILLAAQGCLMAGAPAADEAAKAPAKVAPTSEEQVSHDLLKRLADDIGIKKDQERFLAQQHFETGKVHFGNQDWTRAHACFKRAVALDPTHTEARRLLHKARGLLGLEGGPLGVRMRDYMNQQDAAIQMRKVELHNAYMDAKALFGKGHYREAIDGFTRVKALAESLRPFVDASDLVEDAASSEQKAREAIEQGRREDGRRRMQKAIDESRALRDQRQQLLAARNRARLEQATELFDQGRYAPARALADAILRDDPSSGPAADLRERAMAARSAATVDRAIQDRRRETDLLWRITDSWTSPQNQLVHMPREIFEVVQARTVPAVLGGDGAEPEPWELRLREKLGSQKISFDFVETPLPDVLAFLSSLTDVTIILDPDAIRDGAPTVTLRVNEMTLERALNWICKLASLKYNLKNEAIYVAHPEKLRDRVVLRMYDVSDLTMEIKNFAGRQRALATDLGGGGDQDGAGQMAENWWDDDGDEDEDKGLTGEGLVEFIRRMIAPDSWDRDDHEILEQPFGALFDDKLPKAQAGRELVDVIGLAAGGRTWVGIRTRE